METTNPTTSGGDYHQTEHKLNEEISEKSCGSDWDLGIRDSDNPYHGRAFVDAEDNLKFFPPLYRQRYEVVRQILKEERWSPLPTKVVEFGCAELAMFQYFKQVSHISEVIMVDIDPHILDYYVCRASPLNSDFLNPRQNPLHVEVLCGSVADCDVRLLGANAVVCIELIEHLEMDIVAKLERTIFGFIQPDIAIFTTPNSDFNVLLKGMLGKFRHYDHKFEWSRSEFSDWTNKIISQYPHYKVEISGVGVPPEGKEDVGYCSQLALFIRNHDYVPTQSEDAKEVYTTCRTYDHPGKEPDTRSDEEKLSNEVLYQLNRMAYLELYKGDYEISKIPLLDLTTAVQKIIPSADIESVRSLIAPTDLIEENGQISISYNLYPESSHSHSEDDEQENQRTDEVVAPEEDNEERWDTEDPPLWFLEQSSLAEYHMGVALIDNALNLVHERQVHMTMIESDWVYNSDSDDNSDDDNVNRKYEDEELDGVQADCERRWNSSVPQRVYSSRYQSKADSKSSDSCGRSVIEDSPPHGTSIISDFGSASVCAASSPLSSSNEHELILNTKREPITDSGVDLSPLLNSSYPQDEIGDVFPCGMRSSVVECTFTKTKDLPKSTSVEVLHLDESCSLKRRAGLEYVEYAPSTSVALCYTGQKYYDSDKIPASVNMSMSSERKSLDGSLVRDAVDSCSLDFAGDSGYPNSSSLHHDIDVDLTPEQVDDISSENDERSNQSLSEDELSDLSDRAPALLRRIIHPRHPIVPIVFENVENGDLANNNRDGEGNNAVAELGEEREFVALVQEGEMQALLAVPVAEEVELPKYADPFPDWLIDLLKIEEDCEKSPGFEVQAEEHDCDEGLGEDTI